MGNLKVGTRLAVAFGLLLGLLLLAVAVAFMGIRAGEEQARRLEAENFALLNTVNAMRVAQLNEAVAIRDFVSLPDVESQRQAAQALKASEKAFAQAAAELEKLAADSQEASLRDLAARQRSASAKVSAKVREALDLAEQAEYQPAQTLVYKEVRPLQAAIAADLQALVAASNQVASRRVEEGRAQARRSEARLVAVTLVALLLGIVATVLITRGIVRPLRTALGVAERVAGGDLTGLAVATRRDETGRVLAALANMRDRLAELVRAIRVSATSVSTAAGRISEGNTDLAARTEEQASSLEETAASIEELTASVKQNSHSAGTASELARTAAGLAVEGGEAVGGVVRSMQGIQRSSRKVSDIVALIDDLAFQTNLLALNAAVEAARAGEQGRGFAVVAQQVRVLAQRSAEASRDIKGLVREAVGESDNGAKAAADAGAKMEKVVRVVQDVAQVVSDIARATEEQRTGIEQVNAAIMQMDNVTQSNAGLVQEISGLTEVLLAQAGELVDATGRFKLEELTAAAGGTFPAARALPWDLAPRAA
jgi:methyl-accepting chemotaxis protein